ncbi:hypothetical protein D3C84_374080 [compost metagenome]
MGRLLHHLIGAGKAELTEVDAAKREAGILLTRGVDPHYGEIGLGQLSHYGVTVGRGHLGIDVMQVDPLAVRLERQQGSLVLQQHVGRRLGGLGLLLELGLAHQGHRGLGIHIGVLEQPQGELLFQDPLGRGGDGRLGHQAALHRRQQGSGIFHAAELIHPGVDGLGVAFGLGELLHPPGHAKGHCPGADARRHLILGQPLLAAAVAVVDYAPVAQHHAVELEVAPQQVGEDLAVEAKAHLLDGLAFMGQPLGQGVIGHHGPHPGLEGPLEGHQVIGELAARVDLLLAPGVVGIQAVFLGTGPGEVLDHGDHALLAYAVAPLLEALYVGLDQGFGEQVVLAEGAVDAAPARLGREIRLGGEGLVNADGPVLLAGDVAKALHQGGIADGGEPQGLGPLGEGPGAYAGGVGIMGEVVAGIRAHRHGDAEPHPFQQGLQPVVVVGDGRRIPRHAGDEGIDAILAQHLVHGGEVDPPVCVQHQGAVHHQARLLGQGEPAHQIPGPLGGAKAPVFIGGQGAAAIEILELQAILLDQADGAVPQGGLLRLGAGVVAIAPCQQQDAHAQGETGQSEGGICHYCYLPCVCRSGHSMQNRPASLALRVQGIAGWEHVRKV